MDDRRLKNEIGVELDTATLTSQYLEYRYPQERLGGNSGHRHIL